MGLKHEVAVINDLGQIVKVGYATEPRKDDTEILVEGERYLVTQVVLTKYAQEYANMLARHHKEIMALQDKNFRERGLFLIHARVPYRRL